MRIDSIVRRAGNAIVAVLLVTGAFGCAKAPTIVHDDLLQPLEVRKPWLPAARDLAAARLARTALVAVARDGGADPAVESALADLEALPRPEDEGDEKLIPLAQDLRNATLDDPIAYRAGAREIKKTRGLDPRLEGRLDRTIGDDPLRLAGRRQFDGWHRLWARTFNAVVEPIGNSAITGFVLAPYQLANSLIHYFAEFSNSEPLSLTDRQALVLRKDFLAQHPDTEATPALEEKILRAEIKLDDTLAKRRLKASRAALDADAPDLALHHAEAALAFLDRHPEENERTRRRTSEVTEEARAARSAQTARRRRALEARAAPADRRDTERELAIALLPPRLVPNDLVAPLDRYRARAGSSAAEQARVDGRIDFILALAQHERGFEAGGRRRLERIASQSPTKNEMSRHARALLEDDWQNPHGAFERLRRKATRDELAWRIAGDWVRRPRYPNLPVPIAYLVDARRSP